MNNPVIDLRDVWFKYNGMTVLEEVNLSVEQGDFLALIGPNGGGKTTLLKLILGLLKPLKGEIKVLGKPCRKASPNIGYVPQDVHTNLSFPISVLDVVMMGRLNGKKQEGRSSGNDRDKALESLQRVNMEELADKRIGHLSGGQRQKVFIARALATEPWILLLDEPTASIDTRGQTDFYELLSRLNSDMTILVVSHDIYSVSHYVKAVACVNRRLHYHTHQEVSGDFTSVIQACSVEESCPVKNAAGTLSKNHAKPQGIQ